MKKITCILLIMILLVSFSGCYRSERYDPHFSQPSANVTAEMYLPYKLKNVEKYTYSYYATEDKDAYDRWYVDWRNIVVEEDGSERYIYI